MKKFVLSLAIAFVAIGTTLAQEKQECCKKECCQAEKKEKVTVVKIEDNNGDGIVDCCEAKKATFLSLERGGRSNVIDNYDFLKYFPNLTALGIGTTPVEIIDLRNQKKLEKLNVSNASWLKKIVLSEGCQPEICGQGDAQVEYVKIECAEKCDKAMKSSKK